MSTDLANWTQVANAVWPDEWFTSVSVYDGSVTVIGGVPMLIAAGLTPNTSSVFCHARAYPANLSDPHLEDWAWDQAPLYVPVAPSVPPALPTTHTHTTASTHRRTHTHTRPRTCTLH